MNQRQEIMLVLHEYETYETDQLTPVQARLLADRFGRYITVSPAWRPGVWQLTAQQFVGTIVLDNVHILIQPKVPVHNLFYMLTYAYDLPNFRQEAVALTAGADLFEFIVTIFVRQVEALARRGIYRAYVEEEENQPFLRGRLLLAEQLQHNAAQPQFLYQRINDYTADVLENRILKHTLWLLSRQPFKDSNLRHHLRRAHSAFSAVSSAPIRANDCNKVIYTRLNEAYRRPINLARLLLQHLSLEGDAGEHHFYAFLFDMNQLFERFVGYFMQSALSGDPVFAVDIQPTIWLDSSQKERGYPDIMLRKYGQPIMVLDTKYKIFKDAPSPDDRNQMIVYCHTLGLTQAVLIYANEDRIHYKRDFQKVELQANALSLAGELSIFRERCRNFVADFCHRMSHT